MRYLAMGAAAALALAAGCSDSTVVDSGSSGSGGSGASGGSSGSGASGAGGQCPASPPTSGDSCTFADDGVAKMAECSWGDDPRPPCRINARCASDGSWTVTPIAMGCDTEPLPAACPSSPATAGTVCSDSTLACWYPDGERCWCSDCQNGTQYPICQPIDPPQWACASPPDGCPATIPQAGASCSTPDLNCGPDCALDVVCLDGRWVWRMGDCPICAAPTTPIATPDGPRPIAELRAGDLVYSVDDHGIVAVPILRTGSTAVSRHRVMRVSLASGAVLEISPGHPTADGRSFAELRAGSALDEQTTVTHAELVPYEYARTYDILPASSSGSYFAGGALIGSTLSR